VPRDLPGATSVWPKVLRPGGQSRRVSNPPARRDCEGEIGTVSQTESTRGELGQGLYSLADLRAYVSFPDERRGRFAAGEYALEWLDGALNPVAHAARQPDYSFSDLISLFVVRELVRKGVRPGTIRAAEGYLRRRLRTDRPLLSDKIATDGRHVLYDDEIVGEPEQVEAADLEGQQVMVEPIREQLASVWYSDGWASRWHPTRWVVLDPGVQFGEPVIEGTRLRTADLAAVAEDIGSQAAARRLDVDEAATEAAVRFERRLASLR
jgi:uncharacterized protein (DUF433 family)